MVIVAKDTLISALELLMNILLLFFKSANDHINDKVIVTKLLLNCLAINFL
jgi:hypothetical protein